MSDGSNIPTEVIVRRVEQLQVDANRKRAELDMILEELDWWLAGRKFFTKTDRTSGTTKAAEAPRAGDQKPTLREAIRRVMGEQPTATWSTDRVIARLRALGWLPAGKNAEHTTRGMLADMTSKGDLERVERGRYRLAPTDEEA